MIEVADTFIGKAEPHGENRYGGRVTIEEVLDAIFQETKPSMIPADPRFNNPIEFLIFPKFLVFTVLHLNHLTTLMVPESTQQIMSL